MPACPWFKFYSADFLADTRHLSLRDKGAWIDLLCYMDRAHPRGSITDTADGFARRWSCSTADAEAIIARLTDAQYGVALQTRYNPPTCNAGVSVTETRICITSSRMVNDTAIREAVYNRVSRHRSKRDTDDSDHSSHGDAIHKNEPCNAFVTGRSQKLDARYTNPLTPFEKGGTDLPSAEPKPRKQRRPRTTLEKAKAMIAELDQMEARQ